MRYALFAVLAVLMGFVAVQASSRVMKDPFDGKWKAVVTPDEDAKKAGEKAFDDTLIFKGGKFESVECTPYGFKPVAYDQDTRGGANAAKFTATLKNDEGVVQKWEGAVTGGELRGTLVITKKDGVELRYELKAERTK